MPRTRQSEETRRSALVFAAVSVIAQSRSLDVTVGQIAKQAGVSSGLAHHYFGSKEDLILATMQHLLREFAASVATGLRGATTPRSRLSAILTASFGAEQFRADVVGAWTIFYVKAQSSPEAARLYTLYRKRLSSNLRHALRPLLPAGRVEPVAETIGALIDGVYLREAINPDGLNPTHCKSLVETAVDHLLRGPDDAGS